MTHEVLRAQEQCASTPIPGVSRQKGISQIETQSEGDGRLLPYARSCVPVVQIVAAGR